MSDFKPIIDLLKEIESELLSNVPIHRGDDCVGFQPPTDRDRDLADIIHKFIYEWEDYYK